MKTIKILWLFLLPFVLFAQTIFDTNNRANIWIQDGSNSKTFAVENWSHDAKLDGSDILSDGVPVSSTAYISALQVLVNDLPSSYPKLLHTLPTLSLVGLDPASASLGDSLDTSSVTISPEGGTFDETVAVTFTLSAPVDTVESLVYSINNVPQDTKILPLNGKNSFVIYLAKSGEHNITYGLKSEKTSKTVYFTLTNTDTKRDSDGDGIPDSVEAELGMDPFSNVIPDSDNNGWNDFDEYVRDYTLTDSDGDGWTDWDELQLRGTDPANPYPCVDISAKPTAKTLYSVEYIVTESAGTDLLIVAPPSTKRASLVDLRSDIHYDTSVLMKDNATQLEDDNTTLRLCEMTQTEYGSVLNSGKIPSMRASADIALIARVRYFDNLTQTDKHVYKDWLDAMDPLTLNDYLGSEQFAVLSDDFNATTFKNSYISFLRENLIVSRNFNFSKDSSLAVGFVESAMETRIENNATLLLGHPDFTPPVDMYENTVKALGESNRTANDLYADLKSMLTGDALYEEARSTFDEEDDNTTEERLALFLQQGIDASSTYKLSLMTIVPYVLAEANVTVYDLDLDTDEDSIDNKDEVLPLHYTDPLDADSDDDGVSDSEDACPSDSTDQCINDDIAMDDIDNDGIKDSVDNCPFDPNPDQISTKFEGIGDHCAKKGIVIINPRTNITLYKGDTFVFEALRTLPGDEQNIWLVDDTEVAKDTLSFTQQFNENGAFKICTLLENIHKDDMPCVTVTVLERDLSTELMVHVNDVQEGDEDEKNVLVEVVLNKQALTEVTYAYHTVPNTATEGTDYRNIEGELVFAAGEMRKYLRIPVIGDTEYEEDETFDIVIDGQTSETITIVNDDEEVIVPVVDPVLLSISTIDTEDSNSDGLYEVMEEESNKTVTFVLLLDKPVEKADTSLHFTTNVLEIMPIPDPDDVVYPEYHSMIKNIEGDLTFNIGEQSKEINVTVIGDLINESDKAFTLRLSDAVNITLQTAIVENPDIRDAQLMIVDNDPLPTVSFGSSKYETMEGEQAQIILMLSNKSYQTVEVNLTVDAESTATEMDDYNLSSKHVVITASNPDTVNLSSTVTLNAFSDADEADDGENVMLHIESTNHAIISSDANTSDITIVNAPFENLISQNVFMDVDDGTHGAEPWISDGSVSGTYMLKDIALDGNNSRPENFIKVRSSLYFTAEDENSNLSLYKSDGTSEGTIAEHQFDSSVYSNSLSNFMDVNGVLYFVITTGEYDDSRVELWKADPSSDLGAEYVILLMQGGSGDNQFDIELVENTLFFPSFDDVATGAELYKYDTSLSEYSRVKDIAPGDDNASDPSGFTNINNTLYFTINWGSEVWKSDGTEAGTVPVIDADAFPDRYYEMIHYLNGMVYITADGGRVYKLNQETGSVSLLASHEDTTIRSMVVMNNELYYLVMPYSGSIPRSLMKVQGDSVIEIASFDNQPFLLKSVGNMIYLKSNYELKSYNGTTIQDIITWEIGTGMNIVSNTLNDELFFSIDYYNEDPHYDELWKTDGTEAGTKKLAPVSVK